MDVSDTRTGSARHRDDVGVRCQKLFQDFLEEFRDDGEIKYLKPCMELVAKMERNSLEVVFDDVEKYNQNLSTTIIEEYYRVYPFLCQALANVVKDHGEDDAKKQFFISFVDVPTREKLRHLKSTNVGSLVRITAQVVRTHQVYPELILGTFMCLDCNTINASIEQQFKFTQPTICRNPVCNNRKRFELDIDKSIFIDFQKVKVQEIQSELPRGAIPRSLDIILRAEIVETLQSGDQYDFTGTYITVPDVGVLSFSGAKAEMKQRFKGQVSDSVTDGVRGLKALGVRHLNYRFAFLACSAVSTNSQFYGGDFSGDHATVEEMRKHMTDAEWNKVYEMSKDTNINDNLINSLFPSIHGNEQVKKGVLLMLFGGVSKKTIEGTALRGDINCCIVGDPSTAKSQLLKQVADFSPRAIYTSGKASSAAGLTAAVIRDEESSEFVIEAGAVLLADNGICCIDEFDKMDPRDQVAIHEAMEQQTISIAKAGVRATLNARTSILAAANPIGGRYERSKSLQQNVSLSAPIMSRFDLFFVLIDEGNEVIDYAIAEKILSLHTNKVENVPRKYTREEIRRFISFAKHFKPILTKEAKELLVELYTELRQRDIQTSSKNAWRITVRQLESLIRLSEATAKMECVDEILPKHVNIAYNLLKRSIVRVEQPDINFDEDNDEGIDDPTFVVDPDAMETDPVELPKKKVKLSSKKYSELTEALVVFIKNEEERQLIKDDDSFEGVRKSKIVAHYLESKGDTIATEEELIEEKSLIEKVIERLSYTDHVFIPIHSQGVESDEEQDPLIVVHPNFVLGGST